MAAIQSQHSNSIPNSEPARKQRRCSQRIRSRYFLPARNRPVLTHDASSFPLSQDTYGLIQELVSPNVYLLLVATCLLNQTKGRHALPAFWTLVERYPDQLALSQAHLSDLVSLLRPLGLHNVRAKRLIAMAQTMVEVPYNKENAFRVRGGRRGEQSPIGIYPGVGRYAVDSYRIFVQGDDEWKKVVPLDKELKSYLQWRWAKEGIDWKLDDEEVVGQLDKAGVEPSSDMEDGLDPRPKRSPSKPF